MSNKEKTLDYNPPTTSEGPKQKFGREAGGSESHSSPCSEWDSKLAKLNKEIRRCRKCPLWKTRTKIVFGVGSLNTKIMIVSEAPGREEDLVGLPFTGRAGKLLDKLLKSVGLKREKIYIANVIKCRPPKNRKPKREEIEACLPYLKKQVEIINPQKFILLGEVAFKVFFPDKKLKDFRGKWLKKDGKEFFITYHPAAGLRFPKIRKILEKDFKKVNT